MIVDTNVLKNAANELDNLVGQIESMKGTVNGYAANDVDGLNFSAAKSKILANIDACAARVRNSSSYINSAADAHTQVQNGTKFGSGTQRSGSGSSVGSVSTGNTYNSSSGAGSSSNFVTASTTPTATNATSSTVQKREDTSNNETFTEVKPELKNVGYATYNSNKLTDEAKKITDDEKFSYDEDGYAKYDGKYVITCDSSYGKIGDVLRFTTKDGETIECVIGVATVGEEFKDTINFMIDENKADGFKPKDFSKNLLDNTEKVENTGSCIAGSSGETSNEVANKAVEWAKSIAANDSIGYVNGGMGTNGGYDCTQFVQAAYNEAGIDLSERGNHNQTTIVEYLQGKGFSWHPGPIDPNELQAGDILVNQVHHAEMYIGDGMKIGAHNDWDGAIGDSSGTEISIDPYSEYDNGGWDGYLRYDG